MNNRACTSSDMHLASPQNITREAAWLTGDDYTGARTELVDFIVHRAFYPVLMLQRTGPHKARIEQMQDAMREEIERFRSYRSIEEVAASYKHYLGSELARDILSNLKMLNLAAPRGLHEEFEAKVRELGLEPDTLLTEGIHLLRYDDLSCDRGLSPMTPGCSPPAEGAAR